MIFLASRSPRRRELLAQLGLAFDVLDVEVEERRRADESPGAYVARVARDKARAGWDLVSGRPGSIVLGADTEVVLDDAVFGKPEDAADAMRMLRELSGQAHAVISSVCCRSASGGESADCVSTVTLDVLDRRTIERYVASGEPFGKSGAYAIQGRAAAFITRLEGSYSGVVGLPLHETARLLRRAGLEPLAAPAVTGAFDKDAAGKL